MLLDWRRRTGRLALTLGIVGVASCVSLIAFFIVDGPFGMINDVGNGVLGLLSGAMAVTSWRLGATPKPGNGVLATSVAVLGAAVTVVGSVLILSDITGFFLAGLVSSAGFALVGVWLIAFNRWLGSNPRPRWPIQRRTLGVVAGAAMTLGFISLPGIAMGLDDMDTAPGWINVGGLSWAGTYILFPIWSIWIGRALTRPAEERPKTNTIDRHPAGGD